MAQEAFVLIFTGARSPLLSCRYEVGFTTRLTSLDARKPSPEQRRHGYLHYLSSRSGSQLHFWP